MASEMRPTDLVVGGRDRRDLSDLLLRVDVDRERLDRVDRSDDAGLDTALEAHRVGACGDVAQAFMHHRPGQHGGGRGAVTGDVVGLLGDLLDELGTDPLERILELDLLGDRDAVVGDRGCAPLLVEHDVAALRAERDPHRVGELVHAGFERAAGFLIERNLLRHLRVSSVGRLCPRIRIPRQHSRRTSASTLQPRLLTANWPFGTEDPGAASRPLSR